MATTQKVTVPLPLEQVEAIRELVSADEAQSISGFVQHAVGLALDDAAGWVAVLDDILERTGGPMTPEEQAWAEGVLNGDGSGEEGR